MRRHPWKLLRVSRARRSVQAHPGTPCATTSTSAWTHASLPSRTRGTSRRHPSRWCPQWCGPCTSSAPGHRGAHARTQGTYPRGDGGGEPARVCRPVATLGGPGQRVRPSCSGRPCRCGRRGGWGWEPRAPRGEGTRHGPGAPARQGLAPVGGVGRSDDALAGEGPAGSGPRGMAPASGVLPRSDHSAWAVGGVSQCTPRPHAHRKAASRRRSVGPWGDRIVAHVHGSWAAEALGGLVG